MARLTEKQRRKAATFGGDRFPMPLKTCSKCGTAWPFTDQHFRRTGKGRGWRNECRECERARCRGYVRDQKEYLQRWKAKYPEKVEEYRERDRKTNRSRRKKVLEAYSDGVLACACCGESYFDFLTLDHIYGGGTQHRKVLKGINLYRDLQMRGYPDKHLYRVLCSNCNSALARADVSFEQLREDVIRHRTTKR